MNVYFNAFYLIYFLLQESTMDTPNYWQAMHIPTIYLFEEYIYAEI